MSTAIRASSILPGRREDIELHTADGLRLVGELARRPTGAPVATLVCLHPLPTHGGMMDSHVFRKAAWRLPALADLAVLRFNTRGTSSVRGTSEGAFDAAVGERYDVAAAIEYAEFAELPNIWLRRLVVRHRPGAEVRLRPGGRRRDPALPAAALLGPGGPGRLGRAPAAADRAGAGVRRLPAPGRGPASGSPRCRRPRWSACPAPSTSGSATRRRCSTRSSAGSTRPSPVPLPTTWDGPMETGDVSAYADRTVAAFADTPVPGPAD